MRLKDNIIKDLTENKTARRALEDFHDRSFYTIDRWIKDNDPMLCHQGSLNIIGAHLRKEIDDLVIYEEIDFKPVV